MNYKVVTFGNFGDHMEVVLYPVGEKEVYAKAKTIDEVADHLFRFVGSSGVREHPTMADHGMPKEIMEEVLTMPCLGFGPLGNGAFMGEITIVLFPEGQIYSTLVEKVNGEVLQFDHVSLVECMKFVGRRFASGVVVH